MTECVHFHEYLKCSTFSASENKIQQMLHLITEKKLQDVFPNVDIALRMFVCLFAINCGAERSFSSLKRIKSYLRSVMSHEKLNNFAILSIEAEMVNALDFDSLIDNFSYLKAQRKVF